MEEPMRVSIWGLSGAVALLAVMTAGPLVAQQHGQHHGEDRDDMRGMHSEMMEHCPMAGHGMMMGGMMGMAMHPEALLERADDLDLTDEQMAELEALAERQEEVHRRMMEGMEDFRELLTDEQMEMLREHQRSHMGEMHRRMHDDHDDEDGERPHRHR